MANIELILTPASPTGSMIFTLGAPGPQGVPGPQGAQGIPGVPGSPGVGVPAGGTSGQYLVKATNADYQTEWSSLSLAGYALESWVTSYFYPRTGNPDGFATQAWVTSQNYLTAGSLAAYATMAWVNNELTIYATQSWVTGQGYITASSLSPYLTSATAASTYAVIAAGQPTAGTVGQVLTKSSGANYDSSWQTFIPGDRYLTTSSTSNAVSNGNKTFTIGTGLSYTPTQNITISYDASNHMHGEVLTYNSGTGVLTVDINNHAGTGTYSSWVVNVGGVTPATSVAWGGITGTLGEQSDLSTALNNKLEVSTAASTYYLQTNPSGFIGDAPSDGSQYARKNGAWDVVSGGGSYITSVTSPLAVTSGDLSVDLSAYLTTSAASSTYVPFTGGTMSGLLTSESGTTIAGMNYDGFTATQAGDYSGSLSSTIMQVYHSEAETYGTGASYGSVTRNEITHGYSGYDSFGATNRNATMSNSGGFTGGFSSVPANGTYSLTANGIAGTQTSYGTTYTFAYGPNGVAWNNGSVYGTFDSSGIRFADGTTQTTAYTGGGLSAPPYYTAVWAYGGWYSANVSSIMDGNYTYWNVITV